MRSSQVFLAALAAASALALMRPALAGADEAISIGSMPIDSSGEAYYAKDRGFFAKAGLDATIQTLPNGAAIAAAVAGGSFDIGFSNLTSIATAIHNGVPLQIVAPGGLFVSAAPTTLTYVLASSPIKRPRDLEGKVVAISGLKNSQQGAIEAWVDQDGGHGASVKIIDLPFPAMQAALDAGRVDAIFVAEPALSRVARSTNVRYLGNPYTSIAKQFLIGGWFTTKDWLRTHHAEAVAFVNAMKMTAAWANAHPADSGPILAKYTSVAPDVVSGMTRAKYGVTLEVGDIQPELDNAAKYGFIPPMAAGDLIADPGSDHP